MRIKCEYCGAMIEDTQAECPNCGAANVNVKRMTVTTPRTIEQLKDWYVARNLPPYEVTRFFIGENYTGARAFGIYKDGNEFVVYKNKADGERAIRYRGTDEAYAVNELYLKLKSEILNQKARQGEARSHGGDNYEEDADSGLGRILQSLLLPFVVVALWYSNIGLAGSITALIIFVLLYWLISTGISSHIRLKNKEYTSDSVANNREQPKWLLTNPLDLLRFKRQATIVMVFLLAFGILIGTFYNVPHYYKVNSTTYVSYHDDWYEYSSRDYSRVKYDYLPVELKTHPADYEYAWGRNANWNSHITDFEDSNAYKNYYGSGTRSSSNSGSGSRSWDWSSDSDYDWDSGSDWDSGGTDWDSDW